MSSNNESAWRAGFGRLPDHFRRGMVALRRRHAFGPGNHRPDALRPGLGSVRRRQILGRLVQQPDRPRSPARPAAANRQLPDAPHVADEHHAGGRRPECRLAVAAVQPEPAAAPRIPLGRPRRQPARHRRRTGRRLHHGRLLQSGAALVACRLGDVGGPAGRRRDRPQAAAMDPRPHRMGHASAAGAGHPAERHATLPLAGPRHRRRRADLGHAVRIERRSWRHVPSSSSPASPSALSCTARACASRAPSANPS